MTKEEKRNITILIIITTIIIGTLFTMRNKANKYNEKLQSTKKVENEVDEYVQKWSNNIDKK